jgi:hypothetical protein
MLTGIGHVTAPNASLLQEVPYRLRLAPRRSRESLRIVWVLVCPRGRLDRSRRRSAMACAATTIPTAGSSTRTAPAPASKRRNSAGCGPPAAARRGRDATGSAAAARHSLRIAALAQPRALGAAQARGPGRIAYLDRRQPAATGGLRRPARGQAGCRGDASGAASQSGGQPRYRPQKTTNPPSLTPPLIRRVTACMRVAAALSKGSFLSGCAYRVWTFRRDRHAGLLRA